MNRTVRTFRPRYANRARAGSILLLGGAMVTVAMVAVSQTDWSRLFQAGTALLISAELFVLSVSATVIDGEQVRVRGFGFRQTISLADVVEALPPDRWGSVVRLQLASGDVVGLPYVGPEHLDEVASLTTSVSGPGR